MRRHINEKFPTSTYTKNVDDDTSPFEGTWRKPMHRDAANRPRITWTSAVNLRYMSFPPPSFSNIRIISKRLYFYHKNGRTPSPRMITRLQRYTKNPELPNNSGDFSYLFLFREIFRKEIWGCQDFYLWEGEVLDVASDYAISSWLKSREILQGILKVICSQH